MMNIMSHECKHSMLTLIYDIIFKIDNYDL